MQNRHLHLAFLASVLALLLLAITIVSLSASSTTSSTVLISAVYYDAYLPNQPEESLQLTNVSATPVNLTNWKVTDGEGVMTLTASLGPGASLWIAKAAISFTLEFGYLPDYEYGGNSDPNVPDLARSGNIALADTGDQIIVKNDAGTIIDSVVWGNGTLTGTDWNGATINPYTSGSIGARGQILYRKLNQTTGQPVPDTDTDHDWAQATDDNINGKKVLRPGWDFDRYFQTAKFRQTATITYLIAPDNIFSYVRQAISSSTTSIRYEGYTFDNAELGLALAARAAAGVSVTVLLEGGPVGGIDDQDKWVCQQIENAGGQCWFLITDASATPPIHSRYAYQHAKFMIIDDRWLLTGSENLNYTSMPSDNKADGTSGNRGVWLWTDAPGPLAHLRDVFQHDLDPIHHRDLRRWSVADPRYGAPPPTFTVSYASGGTVYPIQYPQPFVISGTFGFEIVQSPDNALRDQDALLGMVAHAVSGSHVLIEQLYEYKYWGETNSNPLVDPNPRLEAYIAAARRGAYVFLLLDSAFDNPNDPNGNTATCAYVNAIATTEGLRLSCRIGNPTGTGIHNKMVLVWGLGQGWVHTGSINGSENSNKQNREVAVQVQSLAAFQALAQVFWNDCYSIDNSCIEPPPPPQPKYVFLPMVLKSIPEWTGSVVLNNGSCCIGGTAGVPLGIPATFSAISSFSSATQMRTRLGGECRFASIDGSAWEPFSTQKTFTFTPPINWVTIGVAAQFRDSIGTESPLYCDDIDVEGMPWPITPSP